MRIPQPEGFQHTYRPCCRAVAALGVLPIGLLLAGLRIHLLTQPACFAAIPPAVTFRCCRCRLWGGARRPLPRQLQTYAASDVRYLPALAMLMARDLANVSAQYWVHSVLRQHIEGFVGN